MQNVMPLVQVIVAVVLLNVWLMRAGQATPYRGGAARTMREEFAAYGLPTWFMYTVGATKVTAAAMLIVGLWIPSLVFPAAAVVGVLMLGAIAMHVRIHDSFTKAAPAVVMLVLATSICIMPPR